LCSWWSKAEIQNQIATAFANLKPFLQALKDKEIGGATTKKMLQIYDTNTIELKIR
jgi:hypothetical protein